MSGGASSAAAPATSSLSFRLFRSPIHLFVLVTLTVIAATGMVSASDIAFAILSIPYIYFLSVFSFPALAPGPAPSVFDYRNRILATYVLVSAIIGLYLPIAYILDGVFNGDSEGIKPAARHLFLLSCQVFMEGFAFSQAFSLPVFAFVPVAYNSRRLFSIADWFRSEFAKVLEQQQQGLGLGLGLRLLARKGLVMANMAFWAFNLFGFLLPVYLPRALKRYYSIAHTSKD